MANISIYLVLKSINKKMSDDSYSIIIYVLQKIICLERKICLLIV